MRVSRPIFRRNAEFVAIRPIKVKGKVLNPGDKVEGLKLFHLQSLYRRFRIGEKGHPWTENAMKGKGWPTGRTDIVEEKKPEPAKEEIKKSPKKAAPKKAAPKKEAPKAELDDDFDF